MNDTGAHVTKKRFFGILWYKPPVTSELNDSGARVINEIKDIGIIWYKPRVTSELNDSGARVTSELNDSGLTPV